MAMAHFTVLSLVDVAIYNCSLVSCLANLADITVAVRVSLPAATCCALSCSPNSTINGNIALSTRGLHRQDSPWTSPRNKVI